MSMYKNPLQCFMENLANDAHAFKFENAEYGVMLNACEQNGEVWFIGNQVAAMLGYKDTVNAVRDLVPERWRKTITMAEFRRMFDHGDTPWSKENDGGESPQSKRRRGGAQFRTIIKEPGFWRLTSRSDMPRAIEIMDWVYEKVLPSIRKTGTYTVEQPKPMLRTDTRGMTPAPGAFEDMLERFFGVKDYKAPEPARREVPANLTYHGQPCMTMKQAAAHFAVSYSRVRDTLRVRAVKGVDYINVGGSDLRQFSTENGHKFMAALIVITQSGIDKLGRHFGKTTLPLKLYQGKPYLTISDIAAALSVSKRSVEYALQRYAAGEYVVICGSAVRAFTRDNHIRQTSRSLTLVTVSGYDKVRAHYNKAVAVVGEVNLFEEALSDFNTKAVETLIAARRVNRLAQAR